MYRVFVFYRPPTQGRRALSFICRCILQSVIVTLLRRRRSFAWRPCLLNTITVLCCALSYSHHFFSLDKATYCQSQASKVRRAPLKSSAEHGRPHQDISCLRNSQPMLAEIGQGNCGGDHTHALLHRHRSSLDVVGHVIRSHLYTDSSVYVASASAATHTTPAAQPATPAAGKVKRDAGIVHST